VVSATSDSSQDTSEIKPHLRSHLPLSKGKCDGTETKRDMILPSPDPAATSAEDNLNGNVVGGGESITSLARNDDGSTKRDSYSFSFFNP